MSKLINRKNRIIDLFWCWLCGSGALLTIWFVLSIIEVWHHNAVYFDTGMDIGYNPYNYFEIMLNYVWR